MNKKDISNRIVMSKMFTDKGFSLDTKLEISSLFRSLNDDEKEQVAKLLIPILKNARRIKGL